MPNDRRTGKYGSMTIGGTSVPFQSWSFSENNTTNSIYSSSAVGGTIRQVGTIDWSGSFVSYNKTPLIMPGTLVQWQGYTAPTSGQGGSAGIIYSGPVYINSVAFNIDWTSNQPINTTYSFAGNGAVTNSSGTIEAPTVFNTITPKDISIAFDPIPPSAAADTCYINARNLSLTFSIPAATYTDSCTTTTQNGMTYAYVGRQPGTAMDISGSLSVNGYDPAYYPQKLTDFLLTLTDKRDSSTILKASWMQNTGLTDINVSLADTTNVLSATLNLVWNAQKATGELGNVTFGDAVFWPVAAAG